MKKFISGALFATLGIVILQELGETISIGAEYIKSIIGIRVVQNQKKMEELNVIQNEPVQAIGFQYQSEEDEDEFE